MCVRTGTLPLLGRKSRFNKLFTKGKGIFLQKRGTIFQADI